MKIVSFHYTYHPLHFYTAATTSRDVLKIKPCWFIKLTFNDGSSGLGEVSIIEGLSIETSEQIEQALAKYHLHPETIEQSDFSSLPSIQFALEMCFLDQSSTDHVLFKTSFTTGQSPIPINGLVWMGSIDYMIQQVGEKIEQGFSCVKLKIGAQDWKQEMAIIKTIRANWDASKIMIRVDANGAFSPSEALNKLNELSRWDIHSIEQPIEAGQMEEMAKLCAHTPLPIALDEELIGVHVEQRAALLDTIQPQFIILKPSLVGGLAASDHWIELCEKRGIDWWATSALESNIGLSAIAQWVATKNKDGYQGLGTGKLYSNNIQAPLLVEKGELHYTSAPWETNQISKLLA